MANIVRGQFNLQFRQGNASDNIFSTVQITSTADFLVHLHGTNNGPNLSWLGLVNVSSLIHPPHVNPLDLPFNLPTNSGSQYLGCVGGNTGEKLIISGIVTLIALNVPPESMPLVLTLTVISDGVITVTPEVS